MASRRRTPEQIIAKLREAEVGLAQGQTVAQVCKAIGVTEQTFYRWRNEYGGLKLDQVKRLKQLEKENTRLRRAVADPTVDNQILKEAQALIEQWRKLYNEIRPHSALGYKPPAPAALLSRPEWFTLLTSTGSRPGLAVSGLT